MGFPGETEEEFLKTYNFLNEMEIAYLHVFPYSERPNTTANKMKDVVPQGVRNTRVEMLRILSEKKKQAFYRKHLGTARPVLFEKEEDGGNMHGFTDNYIKVTCGYDPLLINEIVPTELSHILDDGTVHGIDVTAGVQVHH